MLVNGITVPISCHIDIHLQQELVITVFKDHATSGNWI